VARYDLDSTQFRGHDIDNGLLATKRYVPQVPSEWVSRERLIEKLKAGLCRRLTLVSAPARYGKTTMISDGLRSTQIPVGWVSLDA
jgi:LuxR family maltose regulon positive regulatory protein